MGVVNDAEPKDPMATAMEYLVDYTVTEIEAYLAYQAACEAEGLDAHGARQWIVHGRPKGPLG